MPTVLLGKTRTPTQLRRYSPNKAAMPGALLLAGVVLNLIAGAGVLMIQFVTDYTRALQILRWMVGSLDVIGMDLVWRMLLFLVPGLVFLLAVTRDLNLIAMDEEWIAIDKPETGGRVEYWIPRDKVFFVRTSRPKKTSSDNASREASASDSTAEHTSEHSESGH